MNKVIVTGAGGLLGSYLVPLLSADAQVFATGHSTRKLEGANVTPLALDLSRPIEPASLPDEVDAVVYLAQSNRFREFPEAVDDVFQVNAAQVLGMLDYARRAGASHFVYASTGSVYAPSREPLTEDSPLLSREPAGFYAASKLAGEILARSYSSLMDVSILRFFFIYGAGQKGDMLIPRLVSSVREGEPVRIQGEEGLTINPIHAVDAAEAVRAALRREASETLNVAGAETLSLKAICDTIGRKLGTAPQYEFNSGQEPPALIADISAMTAALGPPSRSFEEGIDDLL